jgi:hypothetical protein
VSESKEEKATAVAEAMGALAVGKVSRLVFWFLGGNGGCRRLGERRWVMARWGDEAVDGAGGAEPSMKTLR